MMRLNLYHYPSPRGKCIAYLAYTLWECLVGLGRMDGQLKFIPSQYNHAMMAGHLTMSSWILTCMVVLAAFLSGGKYHELIIILFLQSFFVVAIS